MRVPFLASINTSSFSEHDRNVSQVFPPNTTELERLNFFYFLLNVLLWLKLLEQCSFVRRKNQIQSNP